MEEEQGKVFGPLEKIILLAVIGLLVYIGVKNGGCGILERSEKTEFIEPPSNGRSRPAVPKRRNEEAEQSVEDALRKIAESLGQGQENWSEQETPALSKKENEYLQSLSREYQLSDQVANAKDWFYLMKNSYDTYQKVKSLLDRIAPDTEQGVNTDRYAAIFRDEDRAASFYQGLESYFDIPEEKSRNFARQGHTSLEEWARFITTTPNRVSLEN